MPRHGRQQGSDHQDDHRVLGFHPAQEQSHDGDGQVGERGAEIGLRQHHQHRNAHQRSGFDDVLGRAFRLGVGEIFRHGENQHQLHPFRGLKVEGAELHPAARAQILLAEHFHRQQRANRASDTCSGTRSSSA